MSKSEKICNSNLQKLEVRVAGSKGVSVSIPALYAFSRQGCQILHAKFDSYDTIGTGFLVGPDLVLTCYHVVEEIQDSHISCRFDVRLSESGNELWGDPVSVSKVLCKSEYSPLELGNYSLESLQHPGNGHLDYALLRLSKKVGFDQVEILQNTWVRRDWLVLPTTKADLNNKKPLGIVQHPGGREQKIATGYLTKKQPPNAARLRYLVETLPGSSGSPCFLWASDKTDELQLIAMHNFGEPDCPVEKPHLIMVCR